ncbi:MAG TPA: CRTAC1 family protein [bacterium]|nr:CRTAC1 family protein [bacterium]
MKRTLRLALLLVFASGEAFAAPRFRDTTSSSGIDFLHSNGADGHKNYYEVMGSGACLLDADGDGLLDVYLVTCVGSNKLYRNLGGLRFADVTAKSGTGGNTGYGMGAFAADIDNDGDPDLLVTNFGPERLYLNQGGVFWEVSKQAGVGDPLWSCGASFFDANHDGLLDLYVVNYVHVARPDSVVCQGEGGKLRLYCPPKRYPRAQSTYYENRGGAHFREATKSAGLSGFEARGLGISAFDYNRDGWTDLYVANDLDPNWLFKNKGNGTFEEVGMLAGVSHSETGVALSGMGVSAADYDNDGWIDLFVTNYVNEPNTLFHNEGDGFFLDVSAASKLGPMSLPLVGWGTDFFDYDLDGFDDLLVANGHTESEAERVDPTTTYKQRACLCRNRGDGTFEDTTSSDAPALSTPRAGRGAAFGDLDNDGDTDVIIVNQNDRAIVLENAGGTGHHWIGIRTRGTKSNRDGVGARVEVYAGNLHRSREVQAGGSYLSGNDPRILFGLGERARVDSVVIAWPSGLKETRQGLAVDRYHLLTEGR